MLFNFPAFRHSNENKSLKKLFAGYRYFIQEMMYRYEKKILRKRFVCNLDKKNDFKNL